MHRTFIFLVVIIPVLAFAQKPKKLKKKEKSLIEARNPLDTLRVLLITNIEDSVFLRKTSKDISLEKNEGEIRYFFKRLVATMTHPKNAGVGIAAPQVGLQRNIICKRTRMSTSWCGIIWFCIGMIRSATTWITMACLSLSPFT